MRRILAIAVQQHITQRLPQKTGKRISQVACDLCHPRTIGLRRAAAKANLPSSQTHGEKQVVRDQAKRAPDFDGREVDGRQLLPVGLEKSRPGRGPFACRGRFDAIGLEHIADRLSGYHMADMRQGIGDPVVAPGRVFTSKA